MQREKGVLSKPCASCGSALVAQTNADGSTAFAACSKCYPAEAAAKAEPKADPKPADPKPAPKELAAFVAERVTGTTVKEDE